MAKEEIFNDINVHLVGINFHHQEDRLDSQKYFFKSICWVSRRPNNFLSNMTAVYTMGGFIHILLVIAIVIILVRVIQGRRL
jgi:hypothetical protein